MLAGESHPRWHNISASLEKSAEVSAGEIGGGVNQLA